MNLTSILLQPLTVSQLTYQIKNQLETNFASVIVKGEISNCKLSSGHLYFDLKDADAKMPAVMFRGKNAQLSRMPKEGDQVTLKGTLSVYPPQGRYQMIVDSLEFQGVGQLLLKLEELKKKLRERGWFEKERKKALPKFPKSIGVVTSPNGAVIRDIIHVLKRRCQGFHLVINPVRVQGNEAAGEIAQAIRQFNQTGLVDVIILARGGGSLEDLWPFNEEIVASAIFESKLPVISAVGHETDFTISDFVSDIRAPTPSAAAEIVSSETLSHLLFLKKMQEHTSHSLSHLIKRYRSHLQGFMRQPLFLNPYLIVGNLMQKVDDIAKRYNEKMKLIFKEKDQLLIAKHKELSALRPDSKILFLKKNLIQYAKRLNEIEKNIINNQIKKLVTLQAHLNSLDPKNVLKRGYSILFAQKNHSVIVSPQGLEPQDEVEAILSEGKLRLSVLK